MKRAFHAALCASLALSGALSCVLSARAQSHYPVAPTSNASDVIFGVRYQDPYRPLEDTKNATVESWYRSQAAITDAALARLPGRDGLVEEWKSMDLRTPPHYRQVQVEGGRVFYRKTLGGENVGKIYVREGWGGAEQLLFDPESYKKGVPSTVETFVPSFDGKLLLLAISAKGAEWSELRILNVATHELLPDSIFPVAWFGLSWLPDNSGVLYSGSDVKDTKSSEIEQNRQVRLHLLGTPVERDRDVMSNVSTPGLSIAPKEIPLGAVPESAPAYLVGNLATVQSEIRAYIAPIGDLAHAQIGWTSLVQPSDGIVRGLEIHGDWAYGVTYRDAPRYRLVRVRLGKPDWAHAETVLPEAADSIQSISQSRDNLVITYSNGITGRVVRYNFASGRSEEVKLPLSGDVAASCPSAHDDICLVAIESWLRPSTILELDAANGNVKTSVFNAEVAFPEMADLVSEEVEVPGHDGTMIPLSIIHRRDIRMDGSSPCILEGYGAYSISYSPYFDPKFSVANRGVVVAYAHVRGGGEKGEAWYRAGYKATKPNTWLDFISAAEYLVSKGYTSAAHLSGRGTSAGGILISRAITERPDLFAAAVVNVGLANAMRAEFSPNGPVNTPEFGTVKDEADARALYVMDGLQHVQPGVRYPAVLGVGGWNDPRVSVWQPGKFVAAVQDASTSDRPAMLLINFDNGHFTEEKSVAFRNFANQFAFALWQTGHPLFQPPASK